MHVILRQCSLNRGRSRETDVRTAVGITFQTRLTYTTRNGRIDRYPGSYWWTIDAWAQGCNLAGKFVSHRERERRDSVTDVTIQIVMDVRATDTHCTHPNKRLSRTRFGRRYLIDLHLTCSMKTNCFHSTSYIEAQALSGA
jgi:hypothetical protein